MDKLYKSKDAAEYLGLTVQALERMRHRGDGPTFVQQGRFVRYRQADIEAWVQDGTRQCGAA